MGLTERCLRVLQAARTYLLLTLIRTADGGSGKNRLSQLQGATKKEEVSQAVQNTKQHSFQGVSKYLKLLMELPPNKKKNNRNKTFLIDYYDRNICVG